METFLPITYLNDFVFCPYSIYLHQVYDNNSEDIYSAMPQQNGRAEHVHIDHFQTGKREYQKKEVKLLKGIYVISNKLKVYGKIDTYKADEKKLIEHKYQITKAYRGYYYQLWAQYFAMKEMGYEVNQLSFYCIKEKREIPIELPGKEEERELFNHIRSIARYDFEATLTINPIKCRHCIYAALCDKTELEHVYA